MRYTATVISSLILISASWQQGKKPNKPSHDDVQNRLARVDELWSRHGKNFVQVHGKVHRVPNSGTALKAASPKIGDTGTIKGKILKVVDGNSVIVSGEYLGTYAQTPIEIDPRFNPPQTIEYGPVMMVVGVGTKGMLEGQVRKMPLIYLVGTTDARFGEGRSNRILLAVTDSLVGEGLSKDLFVEVLKKESDLGPDRKALDQESKEKSRAVAEEKLRQHEASRSTPDKAAEGKLKLGKLYSDQAAAAKAKGDVKEWRRLQDSAKDVHRDIIKSFPGTIAAEKSQRFLDELKD